MDPSSQPPLTVFEHVSERKVTLSRLRLAMSSGDCALSFSDPGQLVDVATDHNNR
jgi:hypothetical protein